MIGHQVQDTDREKFEKENAENVDASLNDNSTEEATD